MTAPAHFKESDIVRAFKGAKKAGFERVRVTVDRFGNLVIDVGGEAAMNDVRGNEWDVVLPVA
ncbi:hypothetical protein [Sphingomonas sp. DT-204]|uniref:hypothetical protein n=1 Tax=Sphingomonas sp. DT-204 TaxID=3396166 RepID=UPI003F1C6CE7